MARNEWPTFSRGRGKLTAGVLNDLFTVVSEVEELLPGIRSVVHPNRQPRRDRREWFWARIDDSTAVNTAAEVNRWRYAWTEMELDTSGGSAAKTDVFSEKTAGLTGTVSPLSDYALNISEASTDDDVRPAEPIANNVIVKMWMVRDEDGALRFIFGKDSGGGESGFWALITGRQALGSATTRWEYSWKEAIWDQDTTKFQAKTNGRSSNTGGGNFDDPAYNSIESPNNAASVESGGIDVDGTDYPANFAIVPIRGSTSATWTDALSPAVWLRPHIDDENNRIWVFQAMNMHDGTCS